MTEPRPLLSTGHYFPQAPEHIREIFSASEEYAAFPVNLRPAALLLPHGAVEHCGSSAVPLIQLLARDFPEKIVLVGSVHREYDDTLWLPPYGGFETPFGTLPCDGALVLQTAKEIPAAGCSVIPFEEEACFDLILAALGACGFTGPILPVLAGNSSGSVTEALKKLLQKLVAQEGYFPILTANYRTTSQLPSETAAEEALCGEALFKAFRAYFSECPFRWYHGTGTGYSAGYYERTER